MNLKNQPQRRPTRTLLSCALASCLALAAPAVLAQSTSATLRGTVTADAAPAANATVTATNLASGYSSHVDSGASGNYVLGGLPPGTYRIDVTAGGKTSSRTVTLAVGQTASLDLPVGAASATTTLDSVVVQGVMLGETRTSEVATYVSQKQIDSLPQGTRNFLAFADTVPGVSFIIDESGNTRLRSGAQSANAINVFIDGIGQKNYVTTGGIAGQDTSRGNPFPQSAIGEYKVITSNYKAEFDQLSSAAIVAVTRSGSNKFEGSAFWDHTGTDWRSRNIFEERGDFKSESLDEQYGISFGGPIIQDRAHFFLAYEAKKYESPVTFNLGQGFTADQLPPDFAADYGDGNFTRPFDEDLFFGKVDWLIGDDHYFEFSGKKRSETELVQLGGQTLPSAATDNTNDETRFDLRYQFTSGDWLNDAHLSYEKSFWSPRPREFTNGVVLSRNNWWETIARRGGGENFQDKGQKGMAFQDDLTFRGWDDHILKMGVKFKHVSLETAEQRQFNPQFFYDINESLIVPIHVDLGAPVSALGDGTVTSKNKQFGIYIQDDWEVNEHLLLNLGIRWDYESTPSYEDYVTPADVVAALQVSNTNLPNSGVNINDYISNGNSRDGDKDNFAPRFGFSYDLGTDQRHVIFGGIGRSYDRNLFDYIQNEVSKGSWSTFQFDFNTPDHPCDTVNNNRCLDWDPAFLDPEVLRPLAIASGSREVWMINNNLEVPYSDQVSFGMRNIFGLWGNDWISEVTLSHVASYDGVALQLGNRRGNGEFFPNPGDTDPPPFGQGFAPFGNLILVNNALETETNALLLRLEKPFTNASRWSMTAAYTYSEAEQNSNVNGFPFVLNFPNVDDYGMFPGMVSKHRFVATGIYEAPWGITLSGKLTMASALPRYIQDCNEVSPNFCHFTSYKPDDSFKQFDLAASKEFNLVGNLKLRLRADVLNVFNWTNYTGYDDWRGWIYPDVNTNFGNPNSASFQTRTFKLSVGASW